jgi:hypothetical protein
LPVILFSNPIEKDIQLSIYILEVYFRHEDALHGTGREDAPLIALGHRIERETP